MYLAKYLAVVSIQLITAKQYNVSSTSINDNKHIQYSTGFWLHLAFDVVPPKTEIMKGFFLFKVFLEKNDQDIQAECVDVLS